MAQGDVLKSYIKPRWQKIEWSQSSAEINNDKGLDAITEGINEYIENEFSFPTQVTNGIWISPIGTPNPIVNGPITAGFVTTGHTQSGLTTIWRNTVMTGIAQSGIKRMFSALQTFLMSPTYFISLGIPAGTITQIIPDGLPVMPISFPTMAIQGASCQRELELTTFPQDPLENQDQALDIVCRHINIALNANVIAPIPTAGLVGSQPYTGLSTVIIQFA